jgi:hypothetical protein
MTKRKFIGVALGGLTLTFLLFTHQADATTYLWGLSADGTPATQPSGSPESSMPSPYAGPNLGITTAQFDTYATLVPTGTYFVPIVQGSTYSYFGALGGGYGLASWFVSVSYNPVRGTFTTCTQSGAPVIGGFPLQGGGSLGTTCGENTPSVVLWAIPDTINVGETSTLVGLPAYVTSCSIDHGVGNVGKDFISVPVTPPVTTTYTVTCLSGASTVTASATVTVTGTNVNGTCGTANGGTASSVSGSGPWNWTCAGSGTGTTASCSANSLSQPDLTPTALTPHTVIAGQRSTFTATLFNGGTAATPTFTSTIFVCAQGDAACQSSILTKSDSSVWTKVLALVYQVAHASSAINITLTGAAIPASSSGTQSGAYTFGSAGTFQARLCADLPANQVSESNELNNCGNWEVLSVCPSDNTIDGSGNCVPPVAPPPSVPTCSLSASSSSIPSTLTWSSTNATVCSGSGFSTGNATSGSVVVGTAGTYNLTCTGAGGTCNPIGSVTVGGGACTSPRGTLSAAPTRVQMGQGSLISYSNISGITTSCTLTGPGVNRTIPAASCAVPDGTAPTGALTTQSTYILTCDGVERARTIVNVLPKFQNF